jgi:DNA polymerase III subunit chi
MTERVDFYILKSAAAKQRWNFACRLTEKAYLRDLRVVIACDNAADAQALDDLLWTYNEKSFVPHTLASEGQDLDSSTPVHLIVQPTTAATADLLVNLSGTLPVDWEKYPRIAEIVDADEERRRLGRERFKSYRNRKIVPETHQLDEAAEA